jgi:mannose-6-phosphate isomerase-like protein (cupin superfamily)
MPEAQTGENFAALNLGTLEELDQFKFESPVIQVEGKIFLKDLLNLTGAEISFNKLPVGKSIPFYHKHQLNEEIYIFIKGKGEFQIDGKIFPVQEGSIVKVDPEGERCWRNCGDTDLYCVVIQTRSNSYQGATIQDGMGVKKRVTWDQD